MTDELILLKLPVHFQNICDIYPPSVNEVIQNKYFHYFRSILTLTQEEIEDEYVEKDLPLDNLLTPLEYLLNNAFNNIKVKILAEKAFEFFIHEKVTFLFNEKKILIGKVEEETLKVKNVNQLRFLSENNFFAFQNLIRKVLGEKEKEPYRLDEDPRIKRIKAKARYRDKIKAKKGKNLNLSSLMTAICCMGIGITPLNIGELSYASLSKLMECYQNKEKYEIDIKSLLAGADSKQVKPKYWVCNI